MTVIFHYNYLSIKRNNRERKFLCQTWIWRFCIHWMSEREEKKAMFPLNTTWIFLHLKRLTSSPEELTFMRNVWKPYITRSVSSHGCFSVHSARTNFTVLKQLMVQKEYVMSCREIWLFPIWEIERPVALQDLLRIISQLSVGCIA